MAKIGILTFHASHNYGSMLQTYALQHFLKIRGHTVNIINFRTRRQKELYCHPLSLSNNRYKIVFRFLFTRPIWTYLQCRKWNKFERFQNNDLKVSDKECVNWKDVYVFIQHQSYDVIITGGDQIWNVDILDFDKSYFLPGDLGHTRKISYSPSFGQSLSHISSEKLSFVIKCLCDYDAISTREESSSVFLSQHLNRVVSHVCDPVLLLNEKDYEQLIGEKPLLNNHYILYYTPTYSPDLENTAMSFAKEAGLPIITTNPPFFKKSPMEVFQKVGPKEFLNLLKYADYVIGYSLHLVLFSLLFHKEFYALGGDKDSRIKDLLKQLDISDRGRWKNGNGIMTQLDYKVIDEKIKQLRSQSKSFIENNLN